MSIDIPDKREDPTQFRFAYRKSEDLNVVKFLAAQKNGKSTSLKKLIDWYTDIYGFTDVFDNLSFGKLSFGGMENESNEDT